MRSVRLEPDDVEQDLGKRVVEAMRSFDSGKGHTRPFYATVIRRHAANLLRNERARRRDPRTVASLSIIVDAVDDEPVALDATVTDRELDARIGRKRRSGEELASLAMDFESLMKDLPDRWQELLERRKTYSMEEIAAQTGIPEPTLYDWLRQIRARFERAGMKKYLED